MERGAITRAAAMMSSMEMLPLCWMFFTFFRCLDDKGGSRGDNRAGGLPVLDLQLDSDLEALPVGGCLGDVVTNLLWGQTQWTHLGSQRAGCSNFASDCPQVDVLHLSGVELGSPM